MEFDEALPKGTKRRYSPEPETEASEDAKKANQGHHTRKRESSTVVVRNLPINYNYYKVRKLFQNCGNIEHIDVHKTALEDSRIARIEFQDYNDVLTALTKSHKKVGQNEITVEILQNSTLWVTNFPPDYNAYALRQLFGKHDGNVLSVRLPSLRFDSRRRFAYVDMASADEASRLVESLNKSLVDTYKLVVKLSEPSEATKRTDSALLEKRQVLVKNLDQYKVSREMLSEMFKQFGTIEKIAIPTDHDKSSDSTIEKLNSGFAFIDYSDASSALSCLILNKVELEGSPLEVTIADKKAYLERQAVKRLLASKKRRDNIISIYPLDDKTSTAQVKNLIVEQAGIAASDIITIYLVYDHEGALVAAKDAPTAARMSLALNGYELNRKTIWCGTIKDLRNRTPGQIATRNRVRKSLNNEATPANKLQPSNPGTKMTNDDFRSMFLGK
ncbi:LANO_0F13762g1_1 [Lachancea nothofagi CBS 11611]|uniref:LANO_0F13762g1_1 n=1 Tax=Lachancea nothofagi CBS 11611 TaxID=1266666 RepID=A0A1G4KBY8_9SACH|nr:LANO_0F13762g1_1 [Lachancea nothofagi CBS 11611]